MKKYEIIRDGYPFILSCLIITILTFHWAGAIYGIIPGVLTFFFIYFFRNPKLPLPNDASALYSPADGTVMEIKEFYDEEYLNAEAIKVIIFLSVFNIHVNRAPIKGEIKYQRYTCGDFLPAYKKAASFENERHAIGLQQGSKKVLVIQIAGLLARRIVSWATVGNVLEQGECYGMIKFGSSTELIMPKGTEICVKKGQSVDGGITIIGRYKN